MAVLFACLTAVLFGALTVAIGFGLRRASAELGAVTAAVVAFGVAAILALIAMAAGDDLGQAGGLWRFALAGAIAPGVSQFVYTWSVRAAGPSRTGILIGASPVLAGLLAIALLGESFEAALALATIAIAAGGAALIWEPAREAGARVVGTALGLLTAALFAFSAVVLRWASTESDVSPLVAAAVTMGAGAIVAFLMVLPNRMRSRLIPAGSADGLLRAARAFVPAGVIFGFAYAMLVLAYDRGRVTVVAPLTATEALWAVLFTAWLIGARADAINRRVIVAGALVVGGGVVIGIAA